MNILLTADEAAGTHTLRMLERSSHQVAAVITPDHNLPARRFADKMSVPVLKPSRLKDSAFSDWIRAQCIDVLVNVHLLQIIHPDIIAALRVGAFNLHPGPLPDYAGLNAPSWAIYHRAGKFGVTLHWIEEGIDTGRIAYSAPVTVRPDDTGYTLSVRCAEAGLNLISKLLEGLSAHDGAIPGTPQDLTRRRYYRKNERPQNGRLDWTRSASEIDALLRAYNYFPYPSPWRPPGTRCGSTEIEISSLKITRDICRTRPGSVSFDSKGNVRVAASDFWMNLDTIIVGRKEIDAASVLNQGDLLE